MRDTIRRICELQLEYSSQNTPAMKERGNLVRRVLPNELKLLSEQLSIALGEFGEDFHIDASDGIGNKTELPWVRFCSLHMSPKPTEGFYVVLHFSTDGTGVNIAIGCSSSKFHNGYSIVLPPEELAKRTMWVRQVVEESRGTLDPFTDPNDFGARLPLPKSFESASALVKKLTIDQITDVSLEKYLIEAASILRVIYRAQKQGRELSPADQIEIEISGITRPESRGKTGQGFGLTHEERKAVELRAMELAKEWLVSGGFKCKDTSATHPYDFVAEKEEKQLFVEVKGTTSEVATSIAMTSGEVELHRANKGGTILIIVSKIELNADTVERVASGGSLEALVGWNIDDWLLQPTAYRVTRQNLKS